MVPGGGCCGLGPDGVLCPMGRFVVLFQWCGRDAMLWLIARLGVEPVGDMAGYWGRAGLGGGSSISDPLDPEIKTILLIT